MESNYLRKLPRLKSVIYIVLIEIVNTLMAKESTAIDLAICSLISDYNMLYFIKSYDYCKVGYTKDSKAFFERMRKYLTHNPSFQILDIRKGKLEDEKMIHTLIPKELYHYGEWCVWDKEIA